MQKVAGTEGNNSKRLLIHEKYFVVFFYVVVFIGFFIFFTAVHPLYVYDIDDWTYIAPRRNAIPIWGRWNPTRVLPETLMPLVAEAGVHIFMPLNGDYIGSMAIAFALTISFFYTVYFYCFCNFLPQKLVVRTSWRLVLGGFMILLHFLPFMKTQTQNAFMYIGGSVNLLFYYTIPALLNTSLVLWFSGKNQVEEMEVKERIKKPRLKDGILLLLLYLAINSDIFQSILLMAYIASVLLICFLKESIKAKTNIASLLINFCKKNIFGVTVLFIWLVSLFMESQGGRASSLQNSENYLPAVGESIKQLLNTSKGLNHSFQAIFLVIVGMALFLLMSAGRTRTDLDKEYARGIKLYFFSLLITTIYLVLLCARTGVEYLGRSSVFSGILFYILLLMWISLVYIVKKLPFVVNFIPIAIYVLLFTTLVNFRSYRELNLSTYQPIIVKQISEDIVEQVLLADQQGESAMELYVPYYGNDTNWPIPASYGGERISNALYVHGIISRRINIAIVPSEEMNQKYNLN